MKVAILFRRLCRMLALPLAVLALAGAAAATPYIPADGKQVVEHLPSRADPVQRELQKLRAELSKNPDNLPLASALAQRYIEQARTEGDPRYLGYAQAALAPWWTLPRAPDPVLVLRATLRQSSHQFAAALADLDTVLRRDTDNVQAWLTRATVQMVTGDYAGARSSCMRLYSRAPQLVVQACLSNVGSVNGDAKASYANLKAALGRDAGVDPDLRGWVQTLLAEMAARLGDAAAADGWFRQAMAAGEPDSYLLAAYADFLLDRGRAPEVVRLLKDKGRIDSLLLRYAIALKAVGAPEAAAQAEALRVRFDAAMLRGDSVHQREQARYALALRNDPQAAVRLAKLNWAVQKEPADLRILAEAAAASADQEATQLALDWIARTRLEDQTIAAALAKLRAQPKAPA
jgi:tetratricopeptide (TPR) repeat protein